MLQIILIKVDLINLYIVLVTGTDESEGENRSVVTGVVKVTASRHGSQIGQPA